MRVWLADEAATLRAGAALALVLDELCEPAGKPLANGTVGLHVHLLGGLGVGKTTLVRGLLRAMGVRGAVKSPTYTLVEPYQTAHWEVFHFDLYRLADAEELELLGARDYFHSAALCVFEWPSRGVGGLPAPSLVLSLAVEKDGRKMLIEAHDVPGMVLKTGLQMRLKP